MTAWLDLLLAWLAGCVLGSLFFGGLWWTVRKGMNSEQPAVWFLGSLVVRIGLTLVGFYFVLGGHWQRLAICLIGFTMARLAVRWLTRLPVVSPVPSLHTERSHAS